MPRTLGKRLLLIGVIAAMAAAALLVRPDEPADIAIYALALICFVLIVALVRIAGDQQLLWSEMQLLRRALKNQTLH